jgi:hypothetical protein
MVEVNFQGTQDPSRSDDAGKEFDVLVKSLIVGGLIGLLFGLILAYMVFYVWG